MNCARCVIEHLGVELLPAEPGPLVFTDDLIGGTRRQGFAAF
jgi:hypothetical protein